MSMSIFTEHSDIPCLEDVDVVKRNSLRSGWEKEPINCTVESVAEVARSDDDHI
jgi:hypothetical protein